MVAHTRRRLEEEISWEPLRLEDVLEMRMPPPKGCSLFFVSPLPWWWWWGASHGPITRSRVSPTCNQHLPGSGDGSSGLAQAAPWGNPSVLRAGSCPLGNSPRNQVLGRSDLCQRVPGDSHSTSGAFGFALSWLIRCCCRKQVPQGFPIPIQEDFWLPPGPGGLWARNRSVEGLRGERGLCFLQAG